MTEMTCVAPDARITPWCTGLWNDAHRDAWARIVQFVHEHIAAKIGLQLGHAGAKGATKKMWEGVDQPLPTGAWPLIAASDTQYLPGVSQVARAMTEADMDRVTEEFVRATHLGLAAGFDWLELHCAHGYLFSGFLSPLTNRRQDAYGRDLAGRARFPLRVFTAMRAAWPGHLPMSVRVSAHDWAEGGNTADDAVEIARLFRAAGADLIDVSAGQVVHHERPVFGRMWQTPFADRVRRGVHRHHRGGSDHRRRRANGIIARVGPTSWRSAGAPREPGVDPVEAARWGYSGATGGPVPRRESPLERLLARSARRLPTRAPLPGATPGELT